VCAAIQACHDSGVIHRDLKPGNIMVTESDFAAGWDVKVVDFSISKVATDLTQDGQILGTPNYLSPEQVSGKVSPASDQYAIGLMLFVCLTKKHPYAGLQGLPLVRAIEKGQFQKPRELRKDIPEELEQIILTAMHLEPEKRYADVQTFGQKLWLFGSELGQGVWRKYYFQTPALARARNIAKPSTTEIPLVLQMAEGKAPLHAATVVAHYQSTTAVKAERKTNLDPDVGLVAAQSVEVDLGSSPSEAVKTIEDKDARPVSGLGPSAPTGWQWEQSSAGVSSAPAAVHTRGRTGPLRILAVAMGIGILVGGGISVRRVLRRSAPPAAAPLANVAPSSTATSSAVPGGTLLPPPPAKVDPPRAAPVAVGAAATEPVQGDDKEDHAEKPKRRDHEGRRRKPKADEWKVDAEGIPIPP
jgi:serine/threonine-protein kinase